jgi:hypothetical protein
MDIHSNNLLVNLKYLHPNHTPGELMKKLLQLTTLSILVTISSIYGMEKLPAIEGNGSLLNQEESSEASLTDSIGFPIMEGDSGSDSDSEEPLPTIYQTEFYDITKPPSDRTLKGLQKKLKRAVSLPNLNNCSTQELHALYTTIKVIKAYTLPIEHAPLQEASKKILEELKKKIDPAQLPEFLYGTDYKSDDEIDSLQTSAPLYEQAQNNAAHSVRLIYEANKRKIASK